MDVSVIIVSYNTLDFTRKCLQSVYEQTCDINFEVIVSDNGSTDGSIENIKRDFPDVILIENNENLGFGKANNRALEHASGKYIFYLNSDTVLINNAIKIFFDYWENSSNNEKIGALGCNLLNFENRITHSFGSFPTFKHLRRNLILNFINSLIKPLLIHFIGNRSIFKSNFQEYFGNVDYITGADLFVLNDKNAFFDEDFFMYYEETDLQLKMSYLNLERKIIEGPKIIHYEGGSDMLKKRKAYHTFTTATNIFMWYSAVLYLKKNDSNVLHYKTLKNMLKFVWGMPRNRQKCNEYYQKLKLL